MRTDDKNSISPIVVSDDDQDEDLKNADGPFKPDIDGLLGTEEREYIKAQLHKLDGEV